MSKARQLIPLLNRILVEKIAAPTKSVGGLLLPESAVTKIQEGTVVAVGPGLMTKDGTLIPTSLKEGDSVLLPHFGGMEVKLNNKEYFMYTEEEIPGKLQ